jgi:hypothetical protein
MDSSESQSQSCADNLNKNAPLDFSGGVIFLWRILFRPNRSRGNLGLTSQ